jgi:arylsulfatase A-like enzyme
MSFPERFQAHPGTNDAFVSLCDISPTMLEASGSTYDSK